jgi:hypothetical protein
MDPCIRLADRGWNPQNYGAVHLTNRAVAGPGPCEQLSDVVDIRTACGGDLLERLDGSLSPAGLELRDAGRRETRCVSQFLRGHAAMFAPEEKLFFDVDHSINHFRGDQPLFACCKAALDPRGDARVRCRGLQEVRRVTLALTRSMS